VRARQVPGRTHHHHDDQAEAQADADRAECPVVLRVRDDRTAAREHEREGGEAFSGRAPTDVRADVVQAGNQRIY
jgi:hypothetical protein